ncbi:MULTISPECIES: hypothetical protein [unclassified Streptomyces]|uniref:hypothetical protein n=1 Tax=unclassified Streptomyces TaxID=2593676 RepID=UPI002E2D6755|nr:hypothetical protein [Streptomyces sp. NBC_00228]
MSNQPPYPPQQPGWGNGQPPYGQPPFQPEPPKKRSVGKVVGLGCLGIIGLFVVIVIAVAAIGGGSKNDSGGSGNSKSAAPAGKSSDKAGAGTGKSDTTKDATDGKVVFKVWGTAPAGALGGLDIGYGSDSDTRKGTFKDGRFEATLTLDKGAMYYNRARAAPGLRRHQLLGHRGREDEEGPCVRRLQHLRRAAEQQLHRGLVVAGSAGTGRSRPNSNGTITSGGP